jgi:head-tail adaptor
MSISKFFTTSATVQNYTPSTGWGDGSWSDTITIDCHIRPLGGEERYAADKKTVFSTHRLYCEPVGITEGNRVVAGGNTYDVKWVHNVMNWGEHYAVDLEMIE